MRQETLSLQILGLEGVALRRLLLIGMASCLGFFSGDLAGQTNTFPSSGNVGIGTTSPGALLQIDGPTGNDPTIVVSNSGVTKAMLGDAGSSNGGDLLLYNSSGTLRTLLTADGSSSYILDGNFGLGPTQPGSHLSIAGGGIAIGGTSDYYYTATAPEGGMIIKGNVGIGTTAPCTSSNAPSGCKMSVNGAIQAKEVVVNTGWSDYVFDSNYKLTPLGDVAAFVNENHHLPDIPSAAEVTEKGISVGEMQAKLLAKIEELTLHLIEIEKRDLEFKKQIAALQAGNH